MRSLNAHKKWCSDFDPNTYLMYNIVIKSGYLF